MTRAPRKTAEPAAAPPPEAGAAPAADDTPAAGTAASDKSVLKMRDLVAAVARGTGERPAAVKAAVEATLLALGEALRAGRGLNLPGLGKAKVARGGGGKPLVVKLKAGAEALRPKEAQEALADDED